MTDQALVPYEQNAMTLQDTMTLGQTLAQSGYFQDARQAAQAVVKVLAGRELGFGPVASMTGIYIVKSRVTLSANLIAAAVKRSQAYNYRIKRHDTEACSIEFFENGQSVGCSDFTIQDAKKAGLGGDNWTKYPRNMLFARAMSNGAKWFCPDIFGGPVYTPDELGAMEDVETGAVIDVTPTAAQPPSADVQSNGEHWIDKITSSGPVRTRFWAWAKNDMGLKESEVYTALNVEHIHDYTGSMQDAKDAISQWIDEQARAELAEAA